MKRIFASLLLAGVMAQAAAAETFTIDPPHSSITFRVSHLVSEVEGRFNDFSGTIEYDPAKPEASVVNLTVQVKSLDTGTTKRDDHLRSKDFFEVETYPTATFVSKKVKKLDAKNLEVTGDFTLHGITKPVTCKVAIHGPANTAMGRRLGAITEFKIERRTFKVNSWNDPNAVVGDEVDLHITLEAKAAK